MIRPQDSFSNANGTSLACTFFVGGGVRRRSCPFCRRKCAVGIKDALQEHWQRQDDWEAKGGRVMCMCDTTYSASFGVQTAFHVARSRLVFDNCDRIGMHDHTASSLWEVIGGGWISARRSADVRNVFARDMGSLPWCQGAQNVGMCGDICLVEGARHMEKQRMESLVWVKVTTNQDFVSVSRARTSPASPTSEGTLGHHGGRTPRLAAILGRGLRARKHALPRLVV